MDNQAKVKVNLTSRELYEARKRLGREPNETELGMIDIMWSEHCSYKSSREILKRLPKSGKHVVIGPGYDSGVVSIGDGDVIAFKIESHNHPSAIEPYNGAATGIGGIIRDILCMNCRPIGLLDSLRFGNLDTSHSRWLFQNVVKGIADYGNCTGIPTVAGEVEFDESFETNCLVNVACFGFGRAKDLTLGRMDHCGDIIILVGGATGRDGIHGVTFASRVISEESEQDRPAVQIGDPFVKKLVIEATLEALKTGKVTAVKDLGGGGLTCALSEMSSKGNKGVEVYLDNIHIREEGMMPYELLLSESQERMLFTISAEGKEEIFKILEKWNLPYSIIGKVTESGHLVALYHNEVVADVPSTLLTQSPTVKRIAKKQKNQNKKKISTHIVPKDLSETVYQLLATPNIASKESVYMQYDHEVGARTVLKPGDSDAAVLRITGTDKAIAVKVDCNSSHCHLDPYNGHAGAVAEAARNVVASGARPIAITDCCNFGNPENPEVYWQFEEAINGITYILKALNIPCVGGNVSFYNEDERTGKSVKPTTSIVMLGLIEKLNYITNIALKKPRESLILLGKTFRELGGSQYYRLVKNDGGRPPHAIATREKASIKTVISAIRKGYVTAAHDCSKGGLAISLAEMAIKGNLGLQVELGRIPQASYMKHDELLFSESSARFILTTPRVFERKLLALAVKTKVPAIKIGEVTDSDFKITLKKKELVNCSIDRMTQLWQDTVPQAMEII